MIKPKTTVDDIGTGIRYVADTLTPHGFLIVIALQDNFGDLFNTDPAELADYVQKNLKINSGFVGIEHYSNDIMRFVRDYNLDCLDLRHGETLNNMYKTESIAK